MRGVHAALHHIAAAVVVVGVVVSVGVVIVIGVEAWTEREAAAPEVAIMKSAVAKTAEITAVEAARRGHAANHGATTETAATKTASVKSAAAKAATAEAAAMATSATPAPSTSQRHRRRSQANGGNSQQRNHCPPKHKHSPSNRSLATEHSEQVATILENRYRLLPQFRAILIKLNVRKGGRIRAMRWLAMTVDYVSFTNFANASA
jgi:pyruvate/2-oxoglutarate dehydrogenase complex dihydrolipoamide acyltransferase (E2) component